MMAARIEFEKEWLTKFNSKKIKKDNFKVKSTKTKALSSIKSEGLKNLFSEL